MEGNKSGYAEKFKDPRWQKRRLEIFNRDQFSCQECGDSKNQLQVHHLYYVNADPWDYPDSALVTLCASCHEAESEWLRDFQRELVQALKQAGAMAADFRKLAAAFNHARGTGIRDPEWSAIAFMLLQIIDDRNKGGPLWDATYDGYFDEMRKLAEDGRQS